MEGQVQSLISQRAALKSQFTRQANILKVFKVSDTSSYKQLLTREEKFNDLFTKLDEIQHRIETLELNQANEEYRVSFEDSYYDVLAHVSEQIRIGKDLETYQVVNQKTNELSRPLEEIELFLQNFKGINSNEYEVLIYYKEKLGSVANKLDQVMQTNCSETLTALENRLTRVTAEANIYIKRYKHLEEGFAAHPSPSISHYSENSGQHTSSVRLPEVQIPKFSGNLKEWLRFKDIFEALILNNPILTDITRFYHLDCALIGEARNHIAHLQISNANFKSAWETLLQRYDSKRLIVANHVNSLFHPPALIKGSAESLKQFIDFFSSNVSAVQNLQLDVPLHELILSTMLLKNLDLETVKDWESRLDQNVIPKFNDLINFLERRCNSMEVTQTMDIQINSQPAPKFSAKARPNTNDFKINQCLLCPSIHHPYHCPTFKALSVDDRQKFAKKNNLCSMCLRPKIANHFCTSLSCKHCNGYHHSLLHKDRCITNSFKHNDTQPEERKSFAMKSNALHCPVSPSVLLATAIVYLKDSRGQYRPYRAILDSASEVNFVTQKCANQLGFKSISANVSVKTIQSSLHFDKKIYAQIKSKDSCWSSSLNLIILPSIMGNIPDCTIDISKWSIPQNIRLADPFFNESKPIDLLLGAQVFYELLLEGNFNATESRPSLQNTILGWVIAGPKPFLNSLQNRHPMVANCALVTQPQFHLDNLWNAEEIAETIVFSPQEQFCEDHFIANTVRNDEGRFIVRLPFIPDAPKLGHSRAQSLKRLNSLERRLSKDPALRLQYHSFMKEYLELGHMEVTPSSSSSSEPYYIPHHAVIKPDSTTTSLRVVFDASASTTTGYSLNDILARGPVVQDELFSILLRFRTHAIAFVADLTKMYRQVLVHPDDRHYQRILWRFSPSEPVTDYQLCTVTYGTTPASYLATRTLKELALIYKEQYPDAAQILLRDYYVDDQISGSDTEEEAVKLYHDLTSLLSHGGFQIHKWSTNSDLLLSQIPDDLRETAKIKSFDGESESLVKTLGLLWEPSKDLFRILSSKFSLNPSPFTMRSFLSCIASIYDPLGLISPIVTSCKLIFQSLWKAKLSWDQLLPPIIAEKWSHFYDQLPEIENIAIPRLVLIPHASYELHGFCDSSGAAYGACIYVRSTDQKENISVSLLCSKSRIASIKPPTIPQLELCAATLLAELVSRISPSLNLSFNSIHLWSDSRIVLDWIVNPPTKGELFVKNRVYKIQGLTKNCIWHHVPTLQNPADIISRGSDPTSLPCNYLWWNGPPFLQESSNHWPHEYIIDMSKFVPLKLNVLATCLNSTLNERIFSKCSSYPRSVRIMAYVLRAIHNFKNAKTRAIGPITASEFENAKLACFHIIQESSFQSELVALKTDNELPTSSKLKNLSPFLHSDGFLRVGGRLNNSELDYGVKHQIIIPQNHVFTHALVRHTHDQLCHTGVQDTIAALRQYVWIPSARKTVRSVLRKCRNCFRETAKPSQQIMGDLPSTRVQANPPFLNTGVDYTGFFHVKMGFPRSKLIMKVYVAIFVCMCTKAVHIEPVTSLSTAAFLAAFTRFTSRRGLPSKIFSDNGSNFKGAHHEMTQLHQLLNSQRFRTQLETSLPSAHVQWHFIPPQAPHFGGLWESSVKRFKYHFKRSINSASNFIMTFEEFLTLLARIEASINSRPIVPLSEDPGDFHYLSPAHFLIGRPLTTLPSPNLTDIQTNRLTRWQRVQRFNEFLWNKWSKDYLQTLQTKTKWSSISPNLTVGTLVLLIEDRLPPLQWKTGVIEKTFPGRDGRVRVVLVRTANGVMKRPIAKLSPLPID